MSRVPYVAISELGEALASADRHLATECSCSEPDPSCKVCALRHRIRGASDDCEAWRERASDLVRSLDDVAAEASRFLAVCCKRVADGLEAEAELAQARSNLAREEGL